jgi:hypothetical protein
MGLRHSKKCEAISDIRSLIKSEAIVVFVSGYSKKCFDTIELLKSFLLTPFIVNVNQEANILGTKQALFQLAGQYELPIILIRNHYFGSYKELKGSIKSGEFQRLLLSSRIKFTKIESENEDS